MTTWRLLVDDGVSASAGLAVDETLARRVGGGDSPATLRLYTYRSHCALVGRFQDLRGELRLNVCREQGIEVNRRPTGGGAILMGGDQLGVALSVPAAVAEDATDRPATRSVSGTARDDGATFGRARVLLRRFAAGVESGLHALGIDARFRGRNDLEVGGLKIAGLGLHRARSSGLLFHASVLVDLDVPLMLRVLRTPADKLAERRLATIAARIVTVRRSAGRPITLETVRQAVASGFAATFEVALDRARLDEAEREAVAELEHTRYRNPTWIDQRTSVARAEGAARTRTPAGVVEVRVVLAGRLISAAAIGGDFFAPAGAIAGLEAALRGCPGDRAAISRALAPRAGATGLPLPALVSGVRDAVRRARPAAAEEDSGEPYGCFVSPRGTDRPRAAHGS